MRSTFMMNIRRAVVLTVLLGGFTAMAGFAATARADDDCYRRIDKQEYKLQRDIERHGFHSRQADRDRRELAELRERCDRRYNGYDRR
jgi:hypothetical protein